MSSCKINTTADNYVERNLPPAVIRRLESGAFQSLCEHLRERSDEVPNIDLMTVSGFCRNCLSKWLVVEARKLSDDIKDEDEDELVKALDAMGYDEAAQYVYGMMYPEWKKRHAQKASDEQMEKFQNSKPIWASHDKKLLAKRNDQVPSASSTSATSIPAVAPKSTKSSLMSNVCCEDIDNIDNTKTKSAASAETVPTKLTTVANAFVPPPLPEISFSLGVLTVSDRAHSGEYPEGDLSGPMVQEVVASLAQGKTSTNGIQTKIVPDEIDAIQKTLVDWTTTQHLDLIITTGGTGFSSRDVTPEATTAVLDRSCEGLMAFCSNVLQSAQPLAALSRGTAGVKGSTLICNLPGNPHAIREILPVLLPLALQAVADLTGRGFPMPPL